MNRRLMLRVFLAALFVLPSIAIAGSPEITFGFYPSHNREQLLLLADEFCEYVGEETGYEVTPFVSVDYEDLIGKITDDEVQFAWLSPLSFVKAERRQNARVLLKSVRGANPFYWGAIVVHKGRDIETIEDLKGKKMGWTYPSSTAGFIFTKAALHAEGIDTDEFFSENLFLGGYDELVRAVVKNDIDAGACFANDTEGMKGAWTQYLESSESRQLTPIYFTKPIPGDTITGSKRFISSNPNIANKVLRVLLDMGDSKTGKKILGDLYQVDYLVDAEKEDYQSVREAAQLFPDRH